MNMFINIIMLSLFVLFMVFIFGGYHKNKSASREAQREADEKKSKSEDRNVLK